MSRGVLLSMVFATVFFGGNAFAQHTGDFWVGRSAAGQLKLGGLNIEPGGFNPSRETAVLTAVGSTFRATDPGFEANVPADIAEDFYPLDGGANVRLVLVGEPDGPISADFGTACLGDCRTPFPAETAFISLGGSALHRHIRFSLNTAGEQPYDPLRLTYNATFQLIDVGLTGYLPSIPYTVFFATVRCLRGDVNADTLIDFNDIDAFVTALVDPVGATPQQRCAADVDRDGYVTFGDIDAFIVALLAGV